MLYYMRVLPIDSHYFSIKIFPGAKDGYGSPVKSSSVNVSFLNSSGRAQSLFQSIGTHKDLECAKVSVPWLLENHMATFKEHLAWITLIMFSKKAGVRTMWYYHRRRENMDFRRTTTKFREAHGAWYVLYRSISIDVPLESPLHRPHLVGGFDFFHTYIYIYWE